YSDELNCSILFSVQVLSLIDKPLAHVYLGFPVFIAKDEARKAQRVATSLIATIKSSSKSLAGKIIDLSISGCKLTAKDVIGQADTKLLLVTKLSIDGSDKIIQLKGTIKSQLAIQRADGEFYEYGISFNEITSEQKGNIEHYINNI
ncbi:PilZ domain-containing protein, partial [Halorubrum tibetense]